MAIVLAGQSVPTFWLGLLMIRTFAVNLGWLPVSGRGTWGQLVMPSVALALWPLILGAALTACGRPDVGEVGALAAREPPVAAVIRPVPTLRPLSETEGEVVVAAAIAAHEMRRP